MLVQVLLFGPQALAVGSDRVTIKLAAGDHTCAALRALLAESIPALRPTLPAARFAINSAFAPDTTRITATDEVALITLVSGG